MKRVICFLVASIVLTGCAASAENVAIDEEIAKNIARLEKCDEVEIRAAEISEASSKLAKEAKRLQLVWIIDEMQKLRDSGKITQGEWDTFSEYIDARISPPKFPGSDLDLLMQKVVDRGYIEPYLPDNVIALGTKAALSPSSADYQVNFPECFSDIEFSGIKMLSELAPIKGIWADRIENPMDLIP